MHSLSLLISTIAMELLSYSTRLISIILHLLPIYSILLLGCSKKKTPSSGRMGPKNPRPSLVSKGSQRKAEGKSSEGVGGSVEKVSKESMEEKKKPAKKSTEGSKERPKEDGKESPNEKNTPIREDSDVEKESVRTMKLTSVSMATARPQTMMKTAKPPSQVGSKDGEGHDGGYEMCGDLSADELKKIADAAP